MMIHRQHTRRARVTSLTCGVVLAVTMVGGCGADEEDVILDDGFDDISGSTGDPTPRVDDDVVPSEPVPTVDQGSGQSDPVPLVDEGSGQSDPMPGAGDLLAWVKGVDALCAEAIQDYQQFDTQNPDPVSATFAAGNLVGHVADAAAQTSPSDPAAEGLVQALSAYARAEAQTAVVMDQGSADEFTAASDLLNAAGGELQRVASDVGAWSCAELNQEL